MPVTFHTPPAWPPMPDGFIPDAQWAPDPAWDPPPPNWVFYTQDGATTEPPEGAWDPATLAPDDEVSRGGGRRLILGLLAVGAVVMIVVLLAWLFLFNPKGPNLTKDQFDTVFAQGQPVLGRTIQDRSTGQAGEATTTDACQLALNKTLQQGDGWFYAVVNTQDMLFSGSRFTDAPAATSSFELAESSCDADETGTVNGARWFAVMYDNTQVVAVLYGNVSMLSAASRQVDAGPSDIAGAMQQEIASAANR